MSMHSLEAEQSVIGACLLDNRLIDKVADILSRRDFSAMENQIVWAAMVSLRNAGKACDVVTVSERLEEDHTYDDTGGLPYLAEIARNTPIAANALTYAGIVADLSGRRQLVGELGNIEAMVGDKSRELMTIVDDAQGRLARLIRADADQAGPMSADLADMLDVIDRKWSGEQTAMGLSFGLNDLDERTMGMHPGQLILVAGRPAMGKAQPLNANVLTRRGWQRMADIHVGDELASVDGAPSFVTGVFPQGVKDIYEISFSDGRSTRACAEHLWSVNYRDWEAPRVVPTSELISMLNKKRYQNRLWVDAYRGDHGHDEALPLHPWVVGAMIANGNVTNTTPRFSTGDIENLNKLIDLMGGAVSASQDDEYSYRIKGIRQKNILADGLKQIGMWDCLSYEKRIPAMYLEASNAKRIELLAGLIDNDGWVEKTGSVLYSTSSPGLADDVRYLVRSLGGVCNISIKEPVYRGKYGEKKIGRTHYTCTICLPSFDGIVTLPRKMKRLGAKKTSRQKRLNIQSIKLVGLEEAQCISVSHDRHLYITDDFIVTHNTAFALNILRACCVRDQRPALIFSMEMDRRALRDRMAAAVGNLPLQAIRDPKNHMTDELWPRMTSAVQGLKDAPLIVDDRAAMTPSQIRGTAKRWRDHYGDLGVVMVDYLQLMKADGKHGNREQEVAEMSRSMKTMAKELGCPVVALSQLNRSLEQRPNKRPMMSDLRESGSLEQDADLILFLYRDEIYNPDNPDNKGVAEIGIGKQREGETGVVFAHAMLSHARFTDLDHDSIERLVESRKPQPKKQKSAMADF